MDLLLPSRQWFLTSGDPPPPCFNNVWRRFGHCCWVPTIDQAPFPSPPILELGNEKGTIGGFPQSLGRGETAKIHFLCNGHPAQTSCRSGCFGYSSLWRKRFPSLGSRRIVPSSSIYMFPIKDFPPLWRAACAAK
jgi:hypothetical protein